MDRSESSGRPGDTLETFLAHFGVKGMKWGVHRMPSSGGSASEDASRAREISTKAKTGGTKALSNKELQDLITRQNLEQQYARLNPSKTKKAVQLVADILLGVGKQQAIRVLNDAATKGLNAATKKG